jgi:hypothetical protein
MGIRIVMLASASALMLGVPGVARGEVAPQPQDELCVPRRTQPHVGGRDLLPLLDVNGGGQVEDPSPPIGGYVQLWVEASEPSDTSPRCYDDETRSWVNRLFVGRNLSRVLQAKVSVTSPGVIGSVTLASSTRTSTRSDGEVWNTDLSARRILTPHFRVDPGTTISVDVTLSASSTINGDITRNILSVIEQGARLASPTSSLVTTLTSDRLQNAANFVDRSISNLFGQKLSERSQNDSRPGQWFGSRDRGVLATVSAAFPMGNDVWDAGRNRPLGSWTIRVSEPLISVFSTVPFAPPRDDQAVAPCTNTNPQERQACRAFIGLSAATVLNFRLTDNVTLGDALRGDEAISTELSRLQGNTGEAETARRLCSLVASKAEALGLNRYDAAAAVWAFAYETQIAPDGRASLLRAAAERSIPASCKSATLAAALNLL